MIPQRVAIGRFAAAGLTVLAPVSAMAQAPAAPAPAHGAQAPAGPAPRWRLQLTTTGSWNENAYFLGGDEANTWSTTGRASLAHVRTFRRGAFSIGGHGGMIYYPEIDDFNQGTYGGDLGLTWAPSPRTQLSLGQSYDRSNTRELRSLDPEALPLPTSGLNNATSSVSLSQGLSHSWQLGLGGAFTLRRYDDENLIGGEQLHGSLQLSRGLGKSTSAYLSYVYSSSWFQGNQSRVQQALVGARSGTEHTTFDLGGGVAYIESVGQFYPAGHASLSVAGRKTSFGLRYARDFGLAFGYGRQMIADLASASLRYTLARNLSLTAGYYFGYRRDPEQEDYTVLSHVASTGFGWDITRAWGFGAHYSWERNETEGYPAVEGSRVTASLSYGVSWR
ncbi:MAG TPA: hypothetical protein VE359_16740 [Vicinamibacteria bacterium]|nr:hypothetical protein [Vicinamibacteria bacterium]